MQTKRIICPRCKAVLDVRNSRNEAVKQITCPSCKTILQVKFQPKQEPPQQEPIEAPTYYAPPKQPTTDSGATSWLAAAMVPHSWQVEAMVQHSWLRQKKCQRKAMPVWYLKTNPTFLKKARTSLVAKAIPQKQQSRLLPMIAT